MSGSPQINLPSNRGTQAPAASQGTAIEQSRAIAEVQAMVVVAKQAPRDIDGATEAMRHACGMKALADRAFFSFPRAGSDVTGPTIHLARELALIWGNITYGVTELARDDIKGESEMLAYAWDLQTNTRMAHIFIQPHARDTRGGRKALVELRDIYESNANAGARRVREAIFGVLPAWFTEEAKATAHATLARGSDEPLPDRIAKAVSSFAPLNVTEDDLVAKVGRPTAGWTGDDVARLAILWTSLKRNEITLEDAFPGLADKGRVTAQSITDGGQK